MKDRESNIELLRIIAACSVVFSHMSPIISKSLIDSDMIGGGNWIISKALLSFSVCAVNVFVLITGYFSCHSQNRNIGKPLNLILLMVVVNMASYIVQLIAGVQKFSLDGLLIYGLPVNYFVTLFVVLYIISPYINLCIKSLSEKGLVRFILIIFMVFSIYPSVIDIIEDVLGNPIVGISPIGRLGSQSGYNIVNFVLVYCIGASLNNMRLKELVEKNKYLPVFSMVFCVVAVFIWSLFSHSAVNYHNPFVIILAVSTFLWFTQLHFYSKVVNELAKAAFTAFLLHVHLIHHIHIGYFCTFSPIVFLFCIFFSILIIYLVSWVTWWLYDTITKPIFKRLNQIQIPYLFE